MKKFYVVTRDRELRRHPLVAKLREQIIFTNDIKKAESILVLGGDGTLLQTVRRFRKFGKPFFGLNFGHVGFLMNEPIEKAIRELAIGETSLITVNLLEAMICDQRGRSLGREEAFNEFYFERAGTQMAHLEVRVNRKARFLPLFADGIVVCTPAGSTAYNAAAGGQVLPVENKAIVLTGICPAVFHHWRSSILPADSVIEIAAVEPKKRPVRLMADGIKIPGAARIVVRSSDSIVRLGFVRSQDFREKVLRLQFC